MYLIRFRLLAWRDINDTIEYLEEQSGTPLAERFLAATLASLEMLRKMPHLGASCSFQRPELQGFRRWPVDGFERWLIFYRPSASSIEVVRVLHSALDLDAIFN